MPKNEYTRKSDALDAIARQEMIGNPERHIGLAAAYRAVDGVPPADAVDGSQYRSLLSAARKMHTWIFLHTADEFTVYDELGLSDEMNALLGSAGTFEILVKNEGSNM